MCYLFFGYQKSGEINDKDPKTHTVGLAKILEGLSIFKGYDPKCSIKKLQIVVVWNSVLFVAKENKLGG